MLHDLELSDLRGGGCGEEEGGGIAVGRLVRKCAPGGHWRHKDQFGVGDGLGARLFLTNSGGSTVRPSGLRKKQFAPRRMDDVFGPAIS